MKIVIRKIAEVNDKSVKVISLDKKPKCDVIRLGFKAEGFETGDLVKMETDAGVPYGEKGKVMLIVASMEKYKLTKGEQRKYNLDENGDPLPGSEEVLGDEEA